MRLKDIAQRAGVSISTVSRVLNDQYTTAASPTTQELIWKIAREGGYVPNNAARQLKTGEFSENHAAPHRIIYCMLATEPAEYNNDPFYTTLSSCIRTEALKHGFLVEYYFFTPNLEQEDSPSLPYSSHAHGLVIIGRFRPEILPDLKKRFKKIVYIGLNSINARCDQIVCDGYEAAQDAVKAFFAAGHRNIGFIGAPDDSRVAGYKLGLKSCGLPIVPSSVVENIVLSSEGGYQGMNRLLDTMDPANPITAVVCANDTTAIGALRACKERKIPIPSKICLIGMNDIELLRDVSPTLSTMHVPLDEMGATAIKVLVDRIQGGHQQHIKINFPFWLVERESGPSRELPD